MIKPFTIFIAALLAWGITSTQSTQAKPLVLFDQGQSYYQIYLATHAPSSVELAAEELQHFVYEASQTRLPIVKASSPPDSPIISLGVNAASRAAGLDIHGVSLGGYRIITHQDNLYILGPDTSEGKHTAHGGFSTGTLNGVYTFLEKYLNIRWLMPGPMGSDVPKTVRLVLPAINLTNHPGFARRRIPYIQGSHKSVRIWRRRNKQGKSLQLDHGHAWQRTIPASVYKKHPDWFAMFNGKRVPPKGRYKLETTNPQLVRAYAKRAVKSLETTGRYTYSISPSDNKGWSQSPPSRALYDTDPHGKRSVTPLVLDFYIHVARLVKKMAPNKALAGYIYADYLYPPSTGIPPLPDNLYLVVAMSTDYGYGLYRPATRRNFDRVMSAWSAATDKLAYYDIPDRIPQSIGAPLPPALGILAFVYPRLVKYGVKGVYIYGKPAWGTGAVSNYLLAKLNWNPQADVYHLAHEFYRRAYGPKAGKFIEDIYQGINRRMKQVWLEGKGSYGPTPYLVKTVYAEHYPHIEALYLKAKAAAHGKKRQARLAMFGKNLALLQWNLRKRGWIQVNQSSPLYRSDQQISAMLAAPALRLILPPRAIPKTHETGPPAEHLKVTLTSAHPAHAYPMTPLTFRGSTRFLITAPTTGPVTIESPQVTARGETVRYRLWDDSRHMITTGVLVKKRPIQFQAKKDRVYFFDIQARIASYRIQVKHARFAVKTQTPDGKHKRLHLLHNVTPLYFYVPPSTKQFSVTLRSHAPGETVAADILAPSGTAIASLDTSVEAVARGQFTTHGRSGFWTIRFKKPQSGYVDDVYIRLGKNLAPWVISNPDGLITIEKTSK